MPNVGINKNIFLKDQNIFVQKLQASSSEEELAAEKKRDPALPVAAQERSRNTAARSSEGKGQCCSAQQNWSLIFIES